MTMSNNPAPGDSGSPEETPPTEPPPAAPADPAEILRGMEIMVHPISLRWAVKWSQILGEVRQGVTEEDACAESRVPWTTWCRWKQKGKGHPKQTPRGRPMQPYADLVRALRQVLAERHAEVRKARFANAIAGDPMSQERILAEGPAMQLAVAKSHEAKLRVELMKVEIERQRLLLAQEAIRLKRMQEGGPDSTVATIQNVVILPARDTGHGTAHVIGTIDGTEAPALPEGARGVPGLVADTGDGDSDPGEARAAAAGGVDAESWATDGLPPRDRE